MYDKERTKDFKNRSASRFSRPVSPFPRTPGNFTRQRRPFTTFRNRTMSGRYPNRGDRPFLRPAFQPDFPKPHEKQPDYRYPPSVNPTFPITPPGVDRSEYQSFGITNPSNNRNVHYPVTPRPATNNYGNQNVMEMPNFKSVHQSDLNVSELWIEAIAPNRQIYYYNARTRETKWEKPLNVRIIDLNEIQRLTSKPAVEQTQNFQKESQNSFVKTAPANPSFPGPRNFMMPQRFMFPAPTNVRSSAQLIPVPQNIYSSPQIIPTPQNICPSSQIIPTPQNICPSPQIICTPPIESFQNTPVCRFNFMVPPPMFPLPMITEGQAPKLETDYSSKYSEASERESFLKKSDIGKQCTSNEERNYSEEAALGWSTPETKSPLNFLGNTYEKNEEPSNIKEKSSMKSVSKSKISLGMEIERKEKYCYGEGKASVTSIEYSKIPLSTLENTYNEKNVCEVEDTPEMDLDKATDEKNTSEKEDAAQMDLDKSSADCRGIDFDSEDAAETGSTPLLDESKILCSEEISDEREKTVNKSRPVSSTPIPGTCWCVVWTGDEKVFFYNSLDKISVWNRPKELLNRSEVDKLIEKPILTPKDLKSSTSTLGLSTTSSSSNSLSFNSDTNQTSLDASLNSSNLCSMSETSSMPCVKKSYESSTAISVKKLKTDDELEEKPTEFSQNIESSTSKDTGEQTASEEIPHERKIEIFREMLVEKNVSVLSSWEKELHKIVFDSRYLLLPSKERKQVFESYMQEKLKEEKIDRYKELRNQKEKFRSLLKESGVDSKSRYSEFAQLYGKDIRFKLIKKIKEREHLFNDYVLEQIQKEKELEKCKVEQKKNFIQLLSEQKDIEEDTSWTEVEKQISNDKRYKSIQSKSLKEKIFQEYIMEKLSGTKSLSSDNRDDRTSTSIRNREEQVKRDLSVHLKNREREQEWHKHQSAVTNFKALLNDLIKNSDISWHSAKKILKVDHRWENVEQLKTENREDIFNEHINFLNLKKKEQFQHLLDEIPDMSLKASWLDIRKTVLSDPRCTKFSTSERKCEKEFKDYLKQKILAAKTDFKHLLKETKIITYKSKSLLKNSSHLRDIEDALSKDKRYLVLDCMRNERKEILLSYISNLHDKGPPPPPTACEPENRK